MSLNVLIVDDSAVMRAMIIKTLQVCGLQLGEVHQAGNGREGLDALNDHWVDLVFADINMPEMNGEEMIDRMRANPDTADVPVIVVSTEGSQTRIDRLREKGAMFIHKPFAAETISSGIQTLTGVSHEQSA